MTDNKIQYFLFAVLLPGFIVGCERFTKLEPAENEKLQITISANDTVTSSSDPVEFTVRIENLGKSRVVWGYANATCQLDAVIVIECIMLAGWECENPYLALDRVCSDDPDIEQGLDPGESRSERFSWGGKIIEDGVIKALEPGKYEIRGVAGRRLSSNFIMIQVMEP
jgi:hypothetical protein